MPPFLALIASGDATNDVSLSQTKGLKTLLGFCIGSKGPHTADGHHGVGSEAAPHGRGD